MKKGFVELEKILGLFLVIMLIASFFAIYRIWNVADVVVGNSDTWLGQCYSLLEIMNEDIKYGYLEEISTISLKLKKTENKQITYILKGSNLVRIEQGKPEVILLSNLQKGEFFSHPRLKDLVSVVLLSRDSSQIPFFTSFAFRNNRSSE